MPRILHTADWQLGLKLRFVEGDRGARAREERFEVLGRLAALAHEHQVDAVLVAGDVFDDNGVGPRTLLRTREALAAFAPIPVLLLPGNHDPARSDCALARLDAAEHVHVLLDSAPVQLDGLTVYPCPLVRRHQQEDPCRDLPGRQDGESVRIALAHGGVRQFSERTEAPNVIDAAAVIDKGFDYLALGDWHGVYEVSARAWYSGTPEPTRFKEKLPGLALLVDIPATGVLPTVTRLPVARTRWLRHTAALQDSADLDQLQQWLQDLPTASLTLVELTLSGAVSLAGKVRLDKLLADWGQALMFLRVRDDDLQQLPSDADLATLPTHGFVGRAVELLRQSEHPADADALRLLYRLVQEARP